MARFRKTARKAARPARTGSYARRSSGRRTSGRRSVNASRGNTLRIVLEQPAANPVARPLNLLTAAPAATTKKAKF